MERAKRIERIAGLTWFLTRIAATVIVGFWLIEVLRLYAPYLQAHSAELLAGQTGWWSRFVAQTIPSVALFGFVGMGLRMLFSFPGRAPEWGKPHVRHVLRRLGVKDSQFESPHRPTEAAIVEPDEH